MAADCPERELRPGDTLSGKRRSTAKTNPEFSYFKVEHTRNYQIIPRKRNFMKPAAFYSVLLFACMMITPVTSLHAQNLSVDTLQFSSVPMWGMQYRVQLVFVTEKAIEVTTLLSDSAGTVVQKRSMKGKLYPIREGENVPVLFDADIFTAGYHCPVMIYLERLTRMQIYIDDAGCYAGETLTPSQFGPMLREK